MYAVRDVFVVRYSSTRWTWRFETGVNHGLYKTEELAIDHARAEARKHESTVYVEQGNGKFIKLSDLEKPTGTKTNSKRGKR